MIAALLSLVLAQPTSLNLNGQPLTALRCDGGVTCARLGSVAYVYGSGAASSSGPPVDGGFVLWGGSVGSTNERTLTSSATATVNTGTAGQVKIDVVTPIPVTKGGTNLTTISSNQTWVGTAADTVTAKTLPSCSNGTTSKLLFNNTTQEFSCGTDQTGGGGGVSPLFVAQGSP